MSAPQAPRVTCHGCRHFRISHDAAKPWQCMKFGFKSKELPAWLVFASTGTECAYREERPAPPGGGRRPQK